MRSVGDAIPSRDTGISLRASKPPTLSLREHLNSAFNLPPSNYEFTPSNENDPAVLETAEAFGLVTVWSRDLADGTRRFEEITGTKVTYYTGGHPRVAGFTPPSRPNLIFVRVDQSESTIASILSHELVHVAQKDETAKAKELYELILDHLSNDEQKFALRRIREKGYSETQSLTELPAYLVADALTGNNEFGLFDAGNSTNLQSKLNDWFDAIAVLDPSALKDIPDGEYSRLDGGLAEKDYARHAELEARKDSLTPAEVKEAEGIVDRRLAEVGAYWHGTPSGDLRGGTSGLHVGTKQAAMEALEARIGIPADGKGWNGDREYGKTLLAGRKRIESGQYGKYRLTGYNMDAPQEDYFPTKMPKVGASVDIDPTWKPWIRPVLVVGEMSNTPSRPMSDSRANATMKGALTKGNAKRGFYYKNEGEDSGSISAVLPNGDGVKVKLADPFTGVPLRERFNPASDSILRASTPPTVQSRASADFEKSRAFYEQLRKDQEEMPGTTGADPKRANPGATPAARQQGDIAAVIDQFHRTVRKDKDTFEKAREMFEQNPAEVEKWLMEASYGSDPRILNISFGARKIIPAENLIITCQMDFRFDGMTRP